VDDDVHPAGLPSIISKLTAKSAFRPMRTSRPIRLLFALALATTLAGCAGRRTLTVEDLTWNSLGWDSLYYVGGGRYEGKFDRGFNRNGLGTYTFPNGDKLTAIFRDGVVVSRATVDFADGKKYVGEFRDNRLTGRGTLFLSNGDRYDGDFVNGRRHGKGIYTYLTGGQYNGSYINGRRHGTGILTFASGSQYSGSFDNDQITGFGNFTYVDGGRYVGQVLNGLHHGLGRREFGDGRATLEGRWERGEFIWPQQLHF
jgi:hypothetical protein